MTEPDNIEWPPELYKYEHIANVIRQRINDGTYPPGTLLSEVRFEQEFRVARRTVRFAMAIVRGEGLIVTKQAKGSVVVGPGGREGDVLD